MNTATMNSKASGVIVSSLAHFRRVLEVPGVALKLTRYEVAGQAKPHRFANVLRLVKSNHATYAVLVDLATGQISRLDFGKSGEWSFDHNRATHLSGIGTTYSTLLTYEIHEISFTTTDKDNN
jgi:hypothetical protein